MIVRCDQKLSVVLILRNDDTGTRGGSFLRIGLSEEVLCGLGKIVVDRYYRGHNILNDLRDICHNRRAGSGLELIARLLLCPVALRRIRCVLRSLRKALVLLGASRSSALFRLRRSLSLRQISGIEATGYTDCRRKKNRNDRHTAMLLPAMLLSAVSVRIIRTVSARLVRGAAAV